MWRCSYMDVIHGYYQSTWKTRSMLLPHPVKGLCWASNALIMWEIHKSMRWQTPSSWQKKTRSTEDKLHILCPEIYLGIQKMICIKKPLPLKLPTGLPGKKIVIACSAAEWWWWWWMGPLVCPCFRGENVTVICKTVFSLCSLDKFLLKNLIVFIFGNFDLLFTFCSHQGKDTKIPSAQISLYT